MNITGHSGCNILVIEEESRLFVVKSTNDTHYTQRLLRQGLKQEYFNKLENELLGFKIPEIISMKVEKNSLDLKMPYIYSNNIFNHFERNGFSEVIAFVSSLKCFLEYCIENSKMDSVPRLKLIEKLDSTIKNAINNPYANFEIENNKLIESIYNQFSSMDEFLNLPVGLCHGDLTFSNVLFTNREYYLIDFLDSFIDSPLMDMVKIEQDTIFNWSSLLYGGQYDLIHYDIVREYIRNEMCVFFNNYSWYREYNVQFQILNLLRILQYTKSVDNSKYILDCILKLVYREI